MNPNYPNGYRGHENCFWGIMAESNRDLIVESVELDIAARNLTSNKCEVDTLELVFYTYL